MAPAFRAPSFRRTQAGNAEEDDGLPGAAKNTGDDARLYGRARHFSAGATVTSLSPLRLSESATKPEAFISSTKTLR